MKVRIGDVGTSRLISIETRKYRRYINIGKDKPFFKLFDHKIYFENGKTLRKVGSQWLDAKKEKELKDTGKFGEWINSPKQKRFRDLKYKIRGYY